MENRIIAAGFGGQGVLLMGQLLAKAGMEEGQNVSWLPSYGAEMRGGTANCSVILSDEPVGSPLVSVADILIVMNGPSFDKFEGILKPGGLLFVNTSLIERKPKREDVVVIGVPATGIANELGNARVANMVMLGAVIKATGMVGVESVIHALKASLGKSKEHLIPLNQQAMERGADCAQDR